MRHQFSVQKQTAVNPPFVVFQIIPPQDSVLGQHAFLLLVWYQIRNPVISVLRVSQFGHDSGSFRAHNFGWQLLSVWVPGYVEFVILCSVSCVHTVQCFSQSESASAHITPMWHFLTPTGYAVYWTHGYNQRETRPHTLPYQSHIALRRYNIRFVLMFPASEVTRYLHPSPPDSFLPKHQSNHPQSLHNNRLLFFWKSDKSCLQTMSPDW